VSPRDVEIHREDVRIVGRQKT